MWNNTLREKAKLADLYWRKRKYLSIAIVGLVAISGLVTLLGTRAATPTVAVEPEQGTMTSPAAAISDSSASGARAVAFQQPSGSTSSGIGSVPIGPSGAWSLKFDDEFNGTSVDTGKWSFISSAEAIYSTNPIGTSNPGNQQLEFDTPNNCSVANGILTQTAKPDNIGGMNWSSCMIQSSPSYAFHYGYIETRSKFPGPKGFWPAFWTWQSSGNNQWTETDTYEFYSDNHSKIYLTQHSGLGGGCSPTLSFDPTTGFHVYGADIEPTGTDFYIDGKLQCHASGVSTGNTNILVDNFVYSQVPPAAGSIGLHQVDYVRAWQH